MTGDSDPRVFFASERTLLAWVRTGLTVIGLGFVVARFSLFLHTIRQARVPTVQDSGAHYFSTVLGIGLVLLGSAAVAMAAWQHARFSRQLTANERPHAYMMSWSIWFSAFLSIIGVFLALFIALRANPT